MAFSQKDIFTVFTTGYRASRGIIWEWVISISKFFILSGIIFGDWAISVSFCKFFSFSCVKTPIYVCTEKKWEKLTLKNFYSINFGIWAEKTWTVSKTVKHGFQNRSLRVHSNNFRKFSEARIIVWKFSVFQRKDRLSRKIFYAGLPKAHFTCPLQNFEKKLIKVNFAACGFFRILCDFSKSDRKLSPGRQNHKLGVRRKRLRRFFSVANVCSNIFVFWAEELGNSAEKY